LNLPKAFGLCIADEGYAPKYDTGDVLFVHPTRPLAAGCITLVVCTDGRTLLRRFSGWRQSACALRSLIEPNATEELLEREEIRSLHRVIGTLCA
jgi:phage repressor protein C with HTH and peptisase S24 domain